MAAAFTKAMRHLPLLAMLMLFVASASFSIDNSLDGATSANIVEKMDEGLIQVIGRFIATDDGGITYDMPGVQVKASFTGSKELTATFTTTNNAAYNAFVVLCDGEAQYDQSTEEDGYSSFNTSVWTAGEQVTVELCSNLDPEVEHDVVIFKSTEAQWNGRDVVNNFVKLLSINGDGDFSLTTPSALPTRKIEFLGDSITAGFCNMCQFEGIAVSNSLEESQEEDAAAESFYRSWPTLVSNGLGAQFHATAWSGFGMVENCCGGETLASDVWLRTLATLPSNNTNDFHGTVEENYWDFKKWRPDVVVINLGTNDQLGNRPELVASYNATYLDLVMAASKAYGMSTTFFLACGPMDDTYCSNVAWVIEQLTASGIKAVLLDQTPFLDGSHGAACCGHPSEDVDEAMAKGAIGVIQEAMGW